MFLAVAIVIREQSQGKLPFSLGWWAATFVSAASRSVKPRAADVERYAASCQSAHRHRALRYGPVSGERCEPDKP